MKTVPKVMLLVVLLSCMLALSSAVVAETTYRTHIQPLFEARCAACHGAHAPSFAEFEADEERFETMNLGPRMATYPELIMFVVFPDTGALMRRLDDGRRTRDGQPGNMYEHLGNDEAERQQNLKRVQDWVGGPDAWNLARWSEITKAELDQLKLAY